MRSDPNFTDIDASLKLGSKTGSSILSVKVVEANQLGGFASFDNFSAPAVGSERMGAGLNYRNLFGMGDVFSASYYRTTTGGSSQYDFGFSVPINPMNGTVSIRYAPSNYNITQSPFNIKFCIFITSDNPNIFIFKFIYRWLFYIFITLKRYYEWK